MFETILYGLGEAFVNLVFTAIPVGIAYICFKDEPEKTRWERWLDEEE